MSPSDGSFQYECFRCSERHAGLPAVPERKEDRNRDLGRIYCWMGVRPLPHLITTRLTYSSEELPTLGSTVLQNMHFEASSFVQSHYQLILFTGINETLHIEISPLGLRSTCIDFGYFRTDFLTGDHRSPPLYRIEDYREITTKGNDSLAGKLTSSSSLSDS